MNPTQRRRAASLLCAAAAVAAADRAVRAQPSGEMADAESPSERAVVRVEPIGRLFPFLDLYYRLAPARRTRFTIAYRLHRGEEPARVRINLVDGRDTALPLSDRGWFEALPSADDVRRGTRVRVRSAAGEHFRVSLAPAVNLATVADQHGDVDLDLLQVVAALDQFEIEVHGAGPLGVLIPHFRHVQFDGGRGATVVDANGQAYPAPTLRNEPFLTAQALRDARSIHFDTPPERILILPN